MRYRLFPLLLGAACAGLLTGIRPAAGEQPPPVPGELNLTAPPGVDVQARGPVHEAFAEPTAVAPSASLLLTQQPPAPVEEVPPQEKPAGDNIVWIPGYWGYDEEAKDYLWVSGFWRAAPPGRSWTPGHWQRVDAGWQWVSGFWGQPNVVETEYLPTPPPATLDRGPVTPAPAATSSYVPGCWLFQVNRYVWRPGYWVAYKPGWVWTPSYYRWTPSGCIYVAGYWDAPLLDRGLLFAPVRFSRAVYLRRGFVYRPAFVIQPDFLVGALFVRTGRPAFYFGNYFDPGFRRRYVSWVDYRVTRGAYDPNFSYYRAAYAGHPAWERNLRTLYVGRFDGTIGRPPATLALQARAVANLSAARTGGVVIHKNVAITNLQNVSVLQPISRARSLQVTAMAPLASTRPGFIKTAPVRRDVRVEVQSRDRAVEERRSAERYRAISNERRSAEAKVILRKPAAAGVVAPPVRVKVNLPKSVPPARSVRTPPPPAHPREESRRKDR
jgi:hypothetical protein